MNRILYFLIAGILLVLIAPYMFTRNWSGLSFTETGTIGDTIGGITAPITSLIGSVLVYFALRAQIDANKLIQEQFNQQRENDLEQRKLTYISEQINYIRNDINEFNFTEPSGKNNIGTVAIDIFLKNIINISKNGHDTDVLESLPKMVELYKILQIFVELLKVIGKEPLQKEDKKYLTLILQYTFDSKLKAPIDASRIYKSSLYAPCQVCGNSHIGIPDKFFIEFETIQKYISLNSL